MTIYEKAAILAEQTGMHELAALRHLQSREILRRTMHQRRRFSDHFDDTLVATWKD